MKKSISRLAVAVLAVLGPCASAAVLKAPAVVSPALPMSFGVAAAALPLKTPVAALSLPSPAVHLPATLAPLAAVEAARPAAAPAARAASSLERLHESVRKTAKAESSAAQAQFRSAYDGASAPAAAPLDAPSAAPIDAGSAGRVAGKLDRMLADGVRNPGRGDYRDPSGRVHPLDFVYLTRLEAPAAGGVSLFIQYHYAGTDSSVDNYVTLVAGDRPGFLVHYNEYQEGDELRSDRGAARRLTLRTTRNGVLIDVLAGAKGQRTTSEISRRRDGSLEWKQTFATGGVLTLRFAKTK